MLARKLAKASKQGKKRRAIDFTCVIEREAFDV